MLHGVMNTGYLPAVFTMQLPVSAKKPARYRIQLEKLALLTLRPINRIIFSVIDRRIRSGRPLIITTNLPLKEIKNETMLDKRRIYDRILEMCTPMYVGGTSKREAIASMKMEKAKTLLNTNRGKEKCE